MSAEGAVSVGAIAAAPAVAGPAVSVGYTMGSELGTSGIGFDNGAPTFSGLGRSDFSNPGTDQSIFNPGETRNFTPSLGSIPEGPVKGFNFSEMDTIALNPDLSSKVQPESTLGQEINIFGETKAFSPIASISEGPAFLDAFRDTEVIAESKTISIEPTIPSAISDQILVSDIASPHVERISGASATAGVAEVESAIENYMVSSETQTINEQTKPVVESLKSESPETYLQLQSDLESVAKIDLLLSEVKADQEVAVKISAAATTTALERAGLLEIVAEEAQAEEVDSAKVQPSLASEEKPNSATAIVSKTQDESEAEIEEYQPSLTTETDEDSIPQSNVEQIKQDPRLYVDEEANNARRRDTNEAIRKAFEENADPVTGEVSGSDVIAYLEPEPTVEELSEVVVKDGGKSDGSESQRRNQLVSQQFRTVEEWIAANERAIRENNAVTDEQSEKIATIAEFQKVKGKAVDIKETQVYPLAA